MPLLLHEYARKHGTLADESYIRQKRLPQPSA